MANKKISDLTSGSSIGGTEELPIVQSGTTVKTTISAIKTFFDTIFVKKGTLTTNYIPKATSSDTIGDSQIFDDGTNVGIGTIAPTATIHGKGIDATSSNYALKVDNSALSALLYVRNDGVSAFTSAFDGVTAGNANYSYETTLGGLLFSYNAQSNTAFNFYKNSLLRAAIINNDGYFSISPKYRMSLKTLDDNKSHVWFDTDGLVGVGNDYFSSTAQLHVQGSDSTSSNYALKVDNSASSALLYVRNDGLINIGGLTPSQIVGTDASKNLVSIPFGTTAGTVLEGDRITQTITNGVTDKAPSEDAVFDALALKLTAANNLSDLANPLTARNNLKEWDLYITSGDKSTTSNVASNITGLVTPTLTANKRYSISGIMHIGCSSTGGVKIQATLPSAATMWLSAFGQDNSNTSITRTALTVSATLSAVSFCNFNSGNSFVFINGEITMGATAGTIQFGFASGTNTQTSTVYQQGTSITLKQLD